MIVTAIFKSDDGAYEVHFDASTWLSKIESKDMGELFDCDFSSNYVCDRIAYFCADNDVRLKAAISYVEDKHQEDGETGFEVSLDREAAISFLQKNKPEVIEAAKCQRVNHYHYLDKHLNTFWIAVLGDSLNNTHCGGIISAHGDKGYGYRSDWEKAGISFPHAMAMYLLTYTKMMDRPKHESAAWVVENYPKLKQHLPKIDLDDPDLFTPYLQNIFL